MSNDSASHLSGNPDSWPENPYQLLNISRDASFKVVKQAYVALIRIFRPDKRPVEFQKIRRAYETIQNDFASTEFSSHFGMSARFDNHARYHAGDPDSSVDAERSCEFDGKVPGDFDLSLLSDDDLLEIVAKILGDRKLPDFLADWNLHLLKYMLIRSAPDLVNQVANNQPNQTESIGYQQRIQLLFQAFEDHNCYHLAMQWLKCEVDVSPEIVGFDVFNKFLSKCENEFLLPQIYRLRWNVLGHEHFDIIFSDVRRIESRFPLYKHFVVNLLTSALEALVWSPVAELSPEFERVRNQLLQMGDFDVMDRIELAEMAANQYRKLLESTFPHSNLIPIATAGELKYTHRNRWIGAAAEIADEADSIELLDQFFSQQPIAMSRFEIGLQNLATSIARSDWSCNKQLVACFFSRHYNRSYISNRKRILDFCCLNNLSPIVFAQLADSLMGAAKVTWSQLVNNDGPLKCVYYARKAMRAHN